MVEEVTRWIRENAHHLTTDEPAAPLTDVRPLADMVRDAEVVALGAAGRESHELSAVAHRMVRLLVEEEGFRTLVLEGDVPSRIGLDAYVNGGPGDPRALLSAARSFWRTEEMLDLIAWMRDHNRRHPHDPVHLTGSDGGARRAPSSLDQLAAVERCLAEDTIRWQERTGHKVVYWGGLAHTSNGDPRTLSPSPTPATHRNAGSHLRARFGARFVSLGLTFHHGNVPFPVPAPPPEFAEAVLGTAGPDAYLLDLRTAAPAAVRTWLATPTRTRLIGPAYDPAADADHHMSGGSLADWFDAVVHVPEATPARPLKHPGGAE
ncbi:erythromycin esterase family protein [Streptomyces sp. VTCC 41912]|uniref:erythromycin esterase family protein n=1 Tax=Streptomyces TaxID=1883 RepID=UPI001F2B9DCA|nr:erythromycin esterase family protein [Streptomyces noursei]MCE4941863.1 erythromycin esterase family protein [Streptomyces noursei]